MSRLSLLTLSILILAACSPQPAAAPFTNPPPLVNTQEPTLTPSLPPMVDTPTAVPTDTPVSNEAIFQSKVQGGRVAYFNPSASQVCALASDWSGKICTPSNQPVTPTDMAWSPSGDRL